MFLSINYLRKWNIKNLNLDFEDNTITTILGPSGSGKSTILRTIAGITNPDAGRVTVGLEDVTRTPPNKRDVGMVFQNYGLFPNMTALENVCFPLKMRKVKGDPESILEKFGLSEFKNHYPHELSGGMQQRVSLARALVYKPKILLMDEPLGSLDVILRNQLQQEILSIHEETKCCIINVTHDITEAFILSDRLVMLYDGEVQQIGSPKEVYDNPKTEWVHNFIHGGLDHIHKMKNII